MAGLRDGGLRCAFPWLAVRWSRGNVWKRPAEPDGSNLCANIKQKAYSGGGAGAASCSPTWGRARRRQFRTSTALFAPASHTFAFQGHDRLQLAAIAGGRHRSRAHLVPAPLSFHDEDPKQGYGKMFPRPVTRH